MDELPAAGDEASEATHGSLDKPASEKRGLLPFVRKRWKAVLLTLAVIAALATLAVRRSSQDATNAARLAAQKALDANNKLSRPIDPYTFGPLTLRPSENDRVESGIKPGHWTTASLEVRANFDDFRGLLATEMVGPVGDGMDLDGQAFRLRSSRPALLAKMQKKLLDVAVYAPLQSPQPHVAARLLSTGGRDLWNAREFLTLVPPEQFFLVVLAQQIEDYRYLHTLDSIWAPRGYSDERGLQAHYRVLLPKITGAAPLPDQALFWTNTAVVVWDGLDPKLLSAAQQQAMLDWMHWGGQLIVSGPDSLDLLRGSFLDDVLAASPGESWNMSEDTLASLARVSPDTAKKLRVAESWTGQHLDITGREANVLVESDDGQALIAERAVGRGRIVVTAFRLTQRELVDWPSYDALFNAMLLRRPSRRFVKSFEEKVGVAWADGVIDDSARVSQVRFFSRDAGRPVVMPPPQDQLPWRGGLSTRGSTSSMPYNPATGGNVQFNEFKAGVASWDDQSLASQSARELLKEAASISVPRATFVFYMLAGYVLVLVPLNWLIWRWLGRVEMAWAVAPLIAVLFGVLVVRLAQLDIGFDRSATEISLLEMQGDYSRAHLTRYWLLYTSLSTDYTVELANPSAVALPFPSGTGAALRQARTTVTLRQEPATSSTDHPAVQLTNLTVSSNSTGMVHSEEMHALPGGLQLTPLGKPGSYRIRNNTGLRLSKATIVADDRRQVAIGALPPDGEAEFTIPSAATERDATAPTDGDDEEGPLALSGMMDLARRETSPGEMRLVAWTDDELPGIKITPAATQTRRAMALVAHLAYGPPPPVQMDFNSRGQIAQDTEEDGEAIDSFSMPAENPPEQR